MWIIAAWEGILQEVCVNGFEKCCIYSEMGETDYDMLRNESEDDGNVRSGFQEDENTDCEDGDSDIHW
jgi:hypothetical protein